MANGFWTSVTRMLGLNGSGRTAEQEQPRTDGRPGRVSTKTWGKGRGPGRTSTAPTPKPSLKPHPTAPTPRPPAGKDSYAGDFTGKAKLSYAPAADGKADPGEVVWAWVPFEEDHSQGKDRPVLVIARHQGNLLGLMLTSKDHDRDAAQEARYGRSWLDVGTGAWDRQNRPSEVRLDRVLQLEPDAVRREGATLDKPLYEQIAAAVREVKGW